VETIANDYASTFENIGALWVIATEDLLLLFDDDWKLQMAIQIVAVKLCGERARELEPPPLFQNGHEDFVEATWHFDRAMDLYAEGIDEFDPAKIEKATEEIALGKDCIKRATAKFEELQ